ncbi:MAG: DUF4091 domain-containing protein, partial [Bacteroidia bacterium]|nr:DUF4091 domain-containing protein [Bacteroidia bacterium]
MNYYEELPNPARISAEEWTLVNSDINVSFADDNIRYPKEQVPKVSSGEWVTTAWKGEKVHTQLLVWTKKDISSLNISLSDLVNENGSKIGINNIKAGFVRYVMTDEFGEGCDERTPEKYDSSLVADPIDIIDRIDVRSNSVQPVWLSVNVPRDIAGGKYTGLLTVNAGEKFDLRVSINVADHILPPPSDWKYDLDLWQNPDPVAKVHGVELWSDEHYNLMRPYYEMLADAGQKSITAFIIDQPWGPDHVYHRDPTFIKWSRKKDGGWSYDYSVFDRYVEFVMSCGINQKINCYSMITWDLKFIYFDEGKGDTVSVYAKPGSQAYNDLWEPMISDFTNHLKSKGWFGKTTIAMDERDMEGMKAVMALLKRIDPGWKTALAGNYHREIAMDIYDYCIIIHGRFDDDILAQRKAAGMPTTYYTACGEDRPNMFTFSPPAESTWISWYAAANGFTGYLRWAYNNWTEDVLHDTRYKTWPGGDCYQIYPGPRSSIRFEKLIEGIQDFEKIGILKEQFLKDGNSAKLKELNDVLSGFSMENLKIQPASDMV